MSRTVLGILTHHRHKPIDLIYICTILGILDDTGHLPLDPNQHVITLVAIHPTTYARGNTKTHSDTNRRIQHSYYYRYHRCHPSILVQQTVISSVC
jgi:hypothetical protein